MDHSASSSSDLVPRWEAPRDWLSCSTSPSPTTQIDVRDVTIEDNLDHDHDHDHDRKSNQQVREIGSSYGGGVVVVEREHMFDKVVTPSDVGKLNRLVIPKQHAEKYFPLDTTTTTSSSTTTTTVSSSTGGGNNEGNRAGLLLNFEDRTGKSWRFRYSYWNSSQSYVMTKGWSRFVKEKQLTAGDIVSFQRGVGDDLSTKNRFFIDWRRRPPDLHHQYSSHNHYQHQHHHLGTAFSIHHHHHSTWSGGGGGGGGGVGGGGCAHGGLFLRSHPHESHPNARPLSTVVGGVPTIWDHPNSSNNNNNTTHLSPMNGNIMSMVPYATYGSSTTTTSSVVSPSYSAATGSLILLRSPGSINNNTSNPHFLPTTTHHQHHLNNLLSSQFGHWGSVSGRHDHHHNQQGGGSDEPKVVYDSVPVSVSVSAPPPGKRSLRLFGVNMDCTPSTLTDHTPSSSTSNSNFDAPQN